MVNNKPGSEPLKPRLEAFAQSVADGVGLSDSWIHSAEALDKEPPTIVSARVSGSRANARIDVQERIAFLKARNASVDGAQEVTSANLMELMDSVSKTVRHGIEVAEKRGEVTLSQRLRSSLLGHLSRWGRAHKRVGEVVEDTPQIDSATMLARLQSANCSCP